MQLEVIEQREVRFYEDELTAVRAAVALVGRRLSRFYMSHFWTDPGRHGRRAPRGDVAQLDAAALPVEGQP